jgi:Patatin-like phospholipase
MRPFHESSPTVVPPVVRFLASLGLCVAICGCSLLSSDNSRRPVPLPPNTSPDDIYNTIPDPQPAPTPEEAAYLAANPPTQTTTTNRGHTGLPPSEMNGVKKRVFERQQREMKDWKEKFEQQKQMQLDQLRRDSEANEKNAVAREWLESDTFLSRLVWPQLMDSGLVKSKSQYEADSKRINNERLKVMSAALPPAPPKPGSKYNILVLTGGGSQGAFEAGVLLGWQDCGCRPKFDVVTGVSTGALVAAAVFAGPEYDASLRKFYTTSERRDIFKVKKVPPVGLGTDSIATNHPLRTIVQCIVDSPGYFEKVASEYAKGRRFFVGSTNIDTMRFVIWDMGAIASQGTAAAKKLYVDVLLGATAIPPLLTPSRITITIDGKPYEEMHVDGGTTRNVFLYPPSEWVGEAVDPDGKLLAGANVYVIIAGKVYGDAEGTKPKVLAEAARALTTTLSSDERAELFRMYSYCADYDMNFNLAAIPADYNAASSIKFDPADLTNLFNEGYTRIREGRLWNAESPERAVSEVVARRGTVLSTQPIPEIGPFEPPPIGGFGSLPGGRGISRIFP